MRLWKKVLLPSILPVAIAGSVLAGCTASAGDDGLSGRFSTDQEHADSSLATQTQPRTVSGSLFVMENGEPRPVGGARLYLAEILPDEGGENSVAAFDRVSSPSAETNSQGYFVFVNVPPGDYGLILDLVRQAYLLRQPDGEQPLLIHVAATGGTQLGELVYPSLPMPPTAE